MTAQARGIELDVTVSAGRDDCELLSVQLAGVELIGLFQDLAPSICRALETDAMTQILAERDRDEADAAIDWYEEATA